MDLPVETDPKTTTTALSACLEVSAAGGTSDSKNGRSGSVTSTRALGTRGTPHRTSTRGRRGCHKRLKKKLHFTKKKEKKKNAISAFFCELQIENSNFLK